MYRTLPGALIALAPFESACAAPAAPVQAGYTTLAFEGAEVPVRVTFPDAQAAPMPVIVLSHGLGGSADGLTPLATAWAAHGYAVFQPTHPDSLTYRSAAEKAKFLGNPAAAVRDPTFLAAWDERPRQVSAVIDDAAALARAVGLDPARLDLEHVGVAGHSFGAHTTLLCAGLDVGRTDLREPRTDAAVLLSPQGPGGRITAESYAGIRVPTLVVTGSEDRGFLPGQDAAWRLEAWRNLTVPERWLLFLDGADHGLGGISARGDRLLGHHRDPALVDAVIEATLDLWDATLRGDPSARGRLDRGELTAAPGRAHLSGP